MAKILHLYFDYWKYIILGLIGFVIWFIPLALAVKLFTLSPAEAMLAGLLEVGIAISAFLAIRMQGKLERLMKLLQDSKNLQLSH